MKYTSIICALAMSIILLVMYIVQSIICHKVLKIKLIIGFIATGLMALILGLYDVISKHKYVDYAKDIVIITDYVFVCFAFFKNVVDATQKTQLENEFIKSLENDKIFVLLDKKEKIKQISSNLAKLAGVTKKELIGKKFFDFLDENFNLISLNDTEIKLSKVKEHFKIWASECKEGDSSKREFLLTSKDGRDSYVFNFLDTPIFTVSKYSGHLLLGDLDSEQSMLDAQRKLSDTSEKLSSVKARMQALFDVAKEAIFYINIDTGNIWGNDEFLRILNLSHNQMSRSEFEKYIHPDDMPIYQKHISNLTEKNPSYDIKYRYKTGMNYQFVHETGKRIFSSNSDDEIACTIEIVHDKHFEHSDMPLLDSLKDSMQMISDIDQLYRENCPFEVAMFKLTNIPEINEKHGRNIGNMVIGEYVKAVNDKLVNDMLFYRLTGLEFLIVINDGRKMTILRQMLEKEVLTESAMDYGGLHIDIKANFGVAFYNDATNAKDLVDYTKKSLDLSLHPKMNANYLYYNDIK